MKKVYYFVLVIFFSTNYNSLAFDYQRTINDAKFIKNIGVSLDFEGANFMFASKFTANNLICNGYPSFLI